MVPSRQRFSSTRPVTGKFTRCQRMAFSLAILLGLVIGAEAAQHGVTLAGDDLVEHGKDVVYVAPSQRVAVQVVRGNDALLETLHRKGDARATADAVHAGLVCQFTQLEDGRHVVVDPRWAE